MAPLALVTGASGFVGSHLIEALTTAGWRARCLVRGTSSVQWLSKEKTGAAIEIARGDVTDAASLRDAVRGVDVVFHLAGVTSSNRDDDYRRVNVYGTRQVCDALTAHNPQAILVHCSSLAAAGPALEGHPALETDPPRPITAYGASKLDAERVVESSGLPYVMVRPPAVYGPRDKDFLAAFRLAARGYAVRIGPRDQQLSMIYVEDLVRGLIAAARQGVGRGAYYVDGTQCSNADLLKAIAESIEPGRTKPLKVIRIPKLAAFAVAFVDRTMARFTGTRPLLTPDRVRDFTQHDWRCDDARARTELGFVSHVTLAEGMRRTAAWYREVGWL